MPQIVWPVRILGASSEAIPIGPFQMLVCYGLGVVLEVIWSFVVWAFWLIAWNLGAPRVRYSPPETFPLLRASSLLYDSKYSTITGAPELGSGSGTGST